MNDEGNLTLMSHIQWNVKRLYYLNEVTEELLFKF